MAVSVKIPTMLLKLTGNRTDVKVGAKNVRQLIEAIDRKYPGMKGLILSGDGTINHHFLICINEEDVRYLQDLDTPLSNGDHVEIVASIAGGDI
ncbi:MoaD/ThiS family protein [bacterium]|nr:MoaD/ThiS family protein [bacterium]